MVPGQKKYHITIYAHYIHHGICWLLQLLQKQQLSFVSDNTGRMWPTVSSKKCDCPSHQRQYHSADGNWWPAVCRNIRFTWISKVEKKKTPCWWTTWRKYEGLHQIFPDKKVQRNFASTSWKADGRKVGTIFYPRRISYIEYKEAKKLPVFNLSKFKGGFHELAFNQRKKAIRFIGGTYVRRYVSGCSIGSKERNRVDVRFYLERTGRYYSPSKVMNKYLNIIDKPAVDGCDIITIDVDMQDIAERPL